jgi:hypothetical protein
VNVPECLEWPLVQNLAYRVVEKLGFATVLEDKNGRRIQITGNLPLASEEYVTNKRAKCTFYIDSHWPWKIPVVFCLESWVRREVPEWHVYEDGRLCFELDLNWERELPAIVKEYTFGLGASYAAQWLISSSRSLLSRHLFAFRDGITTWPKSWDFWAHTLEDAKEQLSKTQKTR